MITRWSFILIYSQICPLVSEEKIFKDTHYNKKNSPTPMGASFIYWAKFILAILVEDY